MASNDMRSIRWAFRCGEWQPSRQQWLLAAQSVQTEEKDRIGRFVFKRDSKSAMSGRLLIRKAVHEALNIPNREIVLARTAKGKPFLQTAHSQCPMFNFNVSHQGQYAVLAAESSCQVGVDVMQVDRPRGDRTVADFFSTMRRQFTENEWKFIESAKDEWTKLHRFFRFWCLKESYVKALGIGIGFSLHRLEFTPGTDEVPLDRVINDTQVSVDGEVETDWTIEETMLDEVHYVAVALHHTDGIRPADPSLFTMLSENELLDKLESLTDQEDEEYWQNFSNKQDSPAFRTS